MYFFSFNPSLEWGCNFSWWSTYFSLSKKLGINFLTLSIGVLYKSAIFSWYSDKISVLIYILSRAKGQSSCNSHNSLEYSVSTSRANAFELLLVYFFKSNSLGSMHLDLFVGRNLDFELLYELFVSKYIICFDSCFGSQDLNSYCRLCYIYYK